MSLVSGLQPPVAVVGRFAATAALGGLLALASTGNAQDSVPLFNGKSTEGWKRDQVKANIVDGVLRVGGGRGWLRHETIFNDFVLTFEARLVGQGARGGVTVRAWAVADEKAVRETSYRLSLAATPAGASPAATLPDGAGPRSVSTSVRVPTTAGAGSWHTVEIEGLRDSITVKLDGATIITNQAVLSPQGYIGFWADAGFLELRLIGIRELPLPSPVLPPGVYALGNGVTTPSVLYEQKPSYTREALQAGISGMVLMEVVVLADGLVGDTKIRRSLDPIHGLDLQAIRAAKQWRFRPATLNGQPVPAMVTIALTFTIKR